MNPIYVVYLTTYSGNKLPPFYIGYTSESKVLKGYNGSVQSKKYKVIWGQERRDNPHLFKTVILGRYATDKEAMEREEFLHRKLDVANNPLYVNLSIGMAKFGGSGKNHPQYGAHHTEETKQKLRGPRSEEVKQRMRKPKSKEAIQNIKEAAKRKPPISQKTRHKQRESHIGRHHTDETKRRMRESHVGVPKSLLTCPYCGKIGGGGVMYRHHFDHCPGIDSKRVAKATTGFTV